MKKDNEAKRKVSKKVMISFLQEFLLFVYINFLFERLGAKITL